MSDLTLEEQAAALAVRMIGAACDHLIAALAADNVVWNAAQGLRRVEEAATTYPNLPGLGINGKLMADSLLFPLAPVLSDLLEPTVSSPGVLVGIAAASALVRSAGDDGLQVDRLAHTGMLSAELFRFHYRATLAARGDPLMRLTAAFKAWEAPRASEFSH
jgi:hypothetical protein